MKYKGQILPLEIIIGLLVDKLKTSSTKILARQCRKSVAHILASTTIMPQLTNQNQAFQELYCLHLKHLLVNWRLANIDKADLRCVKEGVMKCSEPYAVHALIVNNVILLYCSDRWLMWADCCSLVQAGSAGTPAVSWAGVNELFCLKRRCSLILCCKPVRTGMF